MPEMPPTKAAIEALPLPAKNAVDYRDPKQRLLYLRISPKGTKSWCLRYENPPGTSHRISIGRFPEAARLWTIPGRRTKNGRSHAVPLSDLAMSLITSAKAARVGQARDSEFLFPSPRDPEQPIGPMALTHAWRRLLPNLTIPSPTTKNPDRRKSSRGSSLTICGARALRT